MKNNKICYVCNTHYRFCDNCNEREKQPAWMNLVCCEKCNSIFIICAQFNLGNIGKEDAKKELMAFDVKSATFAKDSVTETIKEILAPDKPESSENGSRKIQD